MCARRPGASMALMPIPTGVPASRRGSVLVVYVNFAVGAAVAHRLMESGVVVLAAAPWALETLSGPAEYDVLLLCPYLDAGERQALLEAAAGREPRPAALELADEVGDPSTVRTLDAGGGHPFVHTVLSALTAPAA